MIAKKQFPPPIKRGRKSLYDFASIRVGHPMIITDHTQNEVLAMLRYFKKVHGGEFTTRRKDGTIYVYRTA